MVPSLQFKVHFIVIMPLGPSVQLYAVNAMLSAHEEKRLCGALHSSLGIGCLMLPHQSEKNRFFIDCDVE